MCISGKMFGSSKKSSAPAKPKTEEAKKRSTLLNDRGGRDNNTTSPKSSVGYAGRGGFDSFGNTSSKGSDPRGRM